MEWFYAVFKKTTLTGQYVDRSICGHILTGELVNTPYCYTSDRNVRLWLVQIASRDVSYMGYWPVHRFTGQYLDHVIEVLTDRGIGWSRYWPVKMVSLNIV